jgi:hypothetical protein
MKNKLIYWAAAVLCLLVAVYGVLLALDVNLLLILQVSDTIGGRPTDTFILSNQSVSTEIATTLQLPVPMPSLPDFRPALIDQIFISLGLVK